MTFKEIEKVLFSGELYIPNDPVLIKEQLRLIQLVNEYNQTPTPTTPENKEIRDSMLKKMFGSIGENAYIEPPFHANFGGKHVHIGKTFYANFNLTLVDDGEIFIGDYVLIGPNVTIITALHPEDPELRKQGYQYNLPVHIGNNVWLGSNVVVFPGVHIGDNSIIGAGSLVTKDIPSGVVAYGSPCKVIRKIKNA